MTITHINLAQLRVFAAIAEEASFSAAAARIGITQSGASQAIRTLEAALGVRLLARYRDGVVPTEIGQAVLADARDALAAVERLQQRCAAAAGQLTGRLRIASVVSAAAHLLPPVLADYRRRYPEVAVTLLEGTDREVLEWVEGAAVDLGLTAECSPETTSIEILADDLRLLVPAGHRLAGRAPVPLADIAPEPFLMSASGCEPAIRQLFATAGLVPRVVFTVRDTLTLVHMVAQGLGVTVMPDLSIPRDEPGLRSLALDPPARRTLLAVTRSAMPPLPAAEKLVQMLTSAKRG